jgi:serine/threonine protein kinase
MKKVFPNGHPSFSLDLMKRFLTFDPNRRITAEQALNDPFFKQQPLPHQEYGSIFIKLSFIDWFFNI